VKTGDDEFGRSRLVDASKAQQLQNGAAAIGEVLVWRIYELVEGVPRFIARPVMVSDNQSKTVPVHLEAGSLEELRKLLPADLHRIPKGAPIDPDAIESWV
jgi:hypothetical protein